MWVVFIFNERRMVFHLISLQNIVLFMCVSACVCVRVAVCRKIENNLYWNIMSHFFLSVLVFKCVWYDLPGKGLRTKCKRKKKRFQPTHRIKDTYFHLNPLILFYIFFLKNKNFFLNFAEILFNSNLNKNRRILKLWFKILHIENFFNCFFKSFHFIFFMHFIAKNKKLYICIFFTYKNCSFLVSTPTHMLAECDRICFGYLYKLVYLHTYIHRTKLTKRNSLRENKFPFQNFLVNTNFPH